MWKAQWPGQFYWENSKGQGGLDGRLLGCMVVQRERELPFKYQMIGEADRMESKG